MNNERRKQLTAVKDTLDEACMELEEIRDEEQDAYDNLPENFQDSDRGTTMTDAVEAIEEVMFSIESVKVQIDEISEEVKCLIKPQVI